MKWRDGEGLWWGIGRGHGDDVLAQRGRVALHLLEDELHGRVGEDGLHLRVVERALACRFGIARLGRERAIQALARLLVPLVELERAPERLRRFRARLCHQQAVALPQPALHCTQHSRAQQ